MLTRSEQSPEGDTALPLDPVDPAAAVDTADATGLELPTGRIARMRGQAERAEQRYQELAATRPLWAMPLSFMQTNTARQGVLLASALAFRLFLWVVPVALVIAAVGAGLARNDNSTVESAAKNFGLTGAAQHEVVVALEQGHRSWVAALLIGLVLFLWASRNLARTLTLVHAHAWQVPLPRSQKEILITSLLLDGGWLLVLLVAACTRLFDVIPGGVVVGFVIEAFVLGLVWLLLTKRMPHGGRGWVDLVPGSLLFGLGFAILHIVSRLYLPGRFSRSADLYGSLGAAVVILAWLLIIADLIVGAAVLNTVFADYRRNRREGDR